MKKVFALVTAMGMTGCATTQQNLLPTETPDFNAHKIKFAAHNLALRASKSGPLYDVSTTEDGKYLEFTPHFNEKAVWNAIHSQLAQSVKKPDLLIGDADCVKNVVINVAMKTVQLAMTDQVNKSNTFGNTMNGISKACNIDPASVADYVNDSWKIMAGTMDGLNFNR